MIKKTLLIKSCQLILTIIKILRRCKLNILGIVSIAKIDQRQEENELYLQLDKKVTFQSTLSIRRSMVTVVAFKYGGMA